ncbi:DUF308 domain-containing protein [Sphingosinicella terrae]|jgi:uncharacterized membrane protein HdeD (DUF308 family)|uniref:DUF308 domain-containing protein n=1 Tax=Sphingosinicella terrae TaxID=2172047 RepID=UPI000E0DB155|nr:DUF308 domain-containing protein [Sphingosinicella terrae]
MASEALTRSGGRRAVILAAALLTLLLGLAALVLPVAKDLPGGTLVGWLLLIAGLAELAAAAARRPDPARSAALAAGAVTALDGLLFVLNPYIAFVPLSWLVTTWLLLRGTLQLVGGLRSREPRVRAWTLFSGGADLLLGLLLLLGLPVAMLVTGLFGPTREIVASFALVLAASFFVTGGALVAIGRAQR